MQDVLASLPTALLWFLVFLFSTTLHEASHAFVALRLRDLTAYRGGQVTLNPWPHIRREPLGMVVIPIVSFFLSGWMFGWASAPFDPAWAHRYPKRSALMAVAGPLANLAITILAAVGIKTGLAAGAFDLPTTLSFSHLVTTPDGSWLSPVGTLLSIAFSLNLILFIFNLLPLPPMDGSSVIQLVLPGDTARRLQSFLRQPMFGWVGILIAWQIFGPIFRPIHRLALQLLYGL